MRSNQTKNTKYLESVQKIDIAIEVVLYALLAFMPFAFGVVHAWSELIVIFSAAVLMLLTAVKFFFSKAKPVLSCALVPLAVFVIVPVFQLVSLPSGVVKTLSPNTYKIKTDLLRKLPKPSETLDSSADEPKKMQVTFYASATQHGLRLVLSVAAIFFVILQHFRASDQIKRLLACITVVGGAVAVLALLQYVTRADGIYWTFQLPHNNIAGTGPFVNHSNYAQFMNLSIGAALALVFVKFHEFFTDRDAYVTTKSYSTRESKKYNNPVHLVTDTVDYLTNQNARWFWFTLGMIILSVASIFISLSRGGMLTLLIAATFTVLLLANRGSIKGRGWIMAFMALGAFICVLWIGFDAVYDRLATLSDFQTTESGRVQILKDIASAWTKFPVFGTGLDTHNFVYPMFDRSTISSMAGHAENEYAQLAEEMGLMGLVPMLLFGIFVWVAFAKCIRSAATPICSAAYGLGFGLLAVLLHSLSDFGQHLPTNAVLTAIFCALLIGLSRSSRKLKSKRYETEIQTSVYSAKDHNSKHSKSGFYNSASEAFFCLFIAAMLFWLTFSPNGALAARAAEKSYTAARKSADYLEILAWQGSSDQYIDLLRNAQEAAELQPDNVEYSHWLNVWRWHSMSRLTDESGNVVLPPQAMGHVISLVFEFCDGIKCCPTYGPSWAVAGQLLYFILENQTINPKEPSAMSGNEDQVKSQVGASMIRTGYTLAPCDATVCFVNGLLEVIEFQRNPTTPDAIKNPDATIQHLELSTKNSDKVGFTFFARAIELDRHLFTDIAAIYQGIDRADLAVELAGDDIGLLNRVASLLSKSGNHSQLADAAREKLFNLLLARADDPDVSGGTLASLAAIYAKEQNYEQAIDLYQRALVMDYGNVYWRLNLAKLMAEHDMNKECISQAKIILRLKPNYQPAVKLIEQVSVK